MLRWTLGLVAALALIGGSGSAFAACTPASASNVNATCTGTTTNQGGGAPGTSAGSDGYGTGAENNLGVTVVPGASVTGTNNGINAVSTTVTNSGTVSGGIFGISASTATVTNSGIISGLNGINATTATVTNSGTISVVHDAISATTAIVTNSGTLSGGFAGIDATTVTATNSGTISGTVGINANNATVTNSGTMSGTFAAIQATGNVTVTNSGTLSGGTHGILSDNIATVTNSGTITGGSFGINALIAIVTNSGTISGNVGIRSAVGPSTVTNSGTIIGSGGTAIDFSASNSDTLAFLPGSRIQGAILLGSGDSVSVVSGPGVASLLTFTPNGPFTLTGSGSVPFVVVGNQVASLDPTPFALADKNLMDFTRGISGVLASLGGASASSGPISSAFAPSAPGSFAARVEDTFASIPALAYANDQAMVFKAPTMVSADGRAVWARGFGGERTQDADGVLLGAHTIFYGGAVGFDMVARPDLRLGLFGGGGQSRLSLDGNAGFTNTDTAFGGLYGRWSFVSFGHASFLDFALHGGGSTNATSRTLTSNVAPFVQVATASYDSSYVSPELKYGIDLPLWSQYTLTPSFGLRYVAGFFGGYTEAGSAANLTVASRTIQDLEERAELKLTRATQVGPDLLLTSVHVGAIGLGRIGDTTVNTVLLGAGLPFVTPGKNDVAGVVGGGGFEWRTREGVSLFGAAEAIGFSDQSTVWDARGGIRIAF